MPNLNDFINLGGWVDKPKEVNYAMMDLPIPSIESSLSDIKDSGKNKTVLLYKYINEIHPNFEQVQQKSDCTSFASSHIVDVLKAIEIVNLGQQEDFINITATEFTYGASRVLVGGGKLGNSGGSLGVWTAKSVVDYGTLVRKKYNEIDLTNYDGNIAVNWGNNGPINPLLKISKETFVKNISQVTTYTSARDALANGYPIIVCSNIGFNNKRDKYGMLYPSGSWAHAMAVIAVDDSHKTPSVLILNSWPENWVSGPQRFGDEPKGSFWCPYDVFERMLMQNDSFVYSDFNGFPVKELDLRIV